MNKNWALGTNGAEIAEVSHEATHVASAASNTLLEREDLLWITGDAPQHVVIRIARDHPPLRYVGWHVWHDYLTNPKTVEVASGASPDRMTLLLVCHAQPGAGTQVWELPTPIAPSDEYVRLKIVETFGPGPTYLNNIVLYANEVGPRFRSSAANTPAVGRQGRSTSRQGSVRGMSALLKELDEDIRSLHKIKTVSPNKNMLLYVPQAPLSILSKTAEETAFDGDENADESDDDDDDLASRSAFTPRRQRHSRLQRPTHDSGTERRVSYSAARFAAQPADQGESLSLAHSRTVDARLGALEQAVASLTQTMVHQREDLALIKKLLLQQAMERRREYQSLRTPGTLQSLAQGHAATAGTGSAGDGLTALSQLLASPPTSHHVSVEFPGDALKAFVEKTVAANLTRHSKRAEAKTLSRVDSYMRNVLSDLSTIVDERVKKCLYDRKPPSEGRSEHFTGSRDADGMSARELSPTAAAYHSPARHRDELLPLASHKSQWHPPGSRDANQGVYVPPTLSNTDGRKSPAHVNDGSGGEHPYYTHASGRQYLATPRGRAGLSGNRVYDAVGSDGGGPVGALTQHGAFKGPGTSTRLDHTARPSASAASSESGAEVMRTLAELNRSLELPSNSLRSAPGHSPRSC